MTADFKGISTGFLHDSLDRLLARAAKRAGIQPALCRIVLALLIDDRVMLEKEAREYSKSTNMQIDLDAVVSQLILRARHQMEVRSGTEEARATDHWFDTMLAACDGSLRTLKDSLSGLDKEQMVCLLKIKPSESLPRKFTASACRHLGAFLSKTAESLRETNFKFHVKKRFLPFFI